MSHTCHQSNSDAVEVVEVPVPSPTPYPLVEALESHVNDLFIVISALEHKLKPVIKLAPNVAVCSRAEYVVPLRETTERLRDNVEYLRNIILRIDI